MHTNKEKMSVTGLPVTAPMQMTVLSTTRAIFGPASPRRVNPQVPVVRTTQDPPRVQKGNSGDVQNGKAAESRPPKDEADRIDVPKTSNATAPPAKAHSHAKGDEPSNQATTGLKATKLPPLSGSASSSMNTKTLVKPSKAASSIADKPTSSKNSGPSPSTKDNQKGKNPTLVTTTGSTTLKSLPSASAKPTKTSPKPSSRGKSPVKGKEAKEAKSDDGSAEEDVVVFRGK